MQHALITGANRGIGLEFTRQLLRRGDYVCAGCRNPDESTKLRGLEDEFPDQLLIFQLDVADPESIHHSLNIVRKQTDSLDLLVNNAGVYSANGSESPKEMLGKLNFEDALSVLRINSLGPLMMTQEYADLLKKSKRARVINLTSGYGSVSQNNTGFPYYYSASKAALNQLTRSLASDLKKWDITVVVMNPGWVATDMGGRHAPLSPSESVRQMLQVIDRITTAQNGQFLNRFGEQESW